jgi:hypothetical protein
MPLLIRHICSSHRIDAPLTAPLTFYSRKWPKDFYHPLGPSKLEEDSSRRTFMECLRLSSHASSTDSRDKIFGVLSLLQPRLRQFLPVDYSLDHIQVFGLAIMICIAECGNLKILRHARLPEVAVSTSACTFGMEEFTNFIQDTQSSRYLGYNHRSGYSPSFFPAEDSQIPWVPAVHVVMMSSATQSLQIVSSSNHGPRSIVKQMLSPSLPPQVLPRFKVRAHLLDMAWGSLSDPDSPMRHRLQAAYGTVDERERLHLQSLFRLPREGEVCGSGYRQLVEFARSDMGKFSTYNWTDMALCEIELTQVPEATVFLTHYSIGSSTSFHRPGDHVFMIDGAPEPYLLRPVGNGTFRIVGHCYLWAAPFLDYWNPGSYKGVWLSRSHDFGESTRKIQIY